MSRILTLYSEYGQSIWLDYIARNLLIDGGLRALVAEGVRGVTSNPTIFQKAIANGTSYDDAISELLHIDNELDDEILYEWLIIQDAQMAADILDPVYDSSGGDDGFVSLEVSPHLAYDTDATIDAARHLWRAVDRPNLMIKVPATVPGLLAIEHLIAEGINVNATLLFSVTRYKAVAEAYIRGLSSNASPEKVASVASFFVSRVDSKVDAALAEIATKEAQALQGKIAVANVKMAYQHFKEIISSTHFETERRRGARPQRPLWASTSTKNPAYSEVLYVEQLIGPKTVNTVPPETLDAFQVQGDLRNTLEVDVDAARRELNALDALGIDLAQITQALEKEGVQKFADSYDQLLAVLKEKRRSIVS
ncbi:MAG: transaldolase [Granulosicoccaceae bacterium]